MMEPNLSACVYVCVGGYICVCASACTLLSSRELPVGNAQQVQFRPWNDDLCHLIRFILSSFKKKKNSTVEECGGNICVHLMPMRSLFDFESFI